MEKRDGVSLRLVGGPGGAMLDYDGHQEISSTDMSPAFDAGSKILLSKRSGFDQEVVALTPEFFTSRHVHAKDLFRYV